MNAKGFFFLKWGRRLHWTFAGPGSWESRSRQLVLTSQEKSPPRRRTEGHFEETCRSCGEIIRVCNNDEKGKDSFKFVHVPDQSY